VTVKPVDPQWLEAAWQRQVSLTKPPGSLGFLEELGCRLAAIQQTLRPTLGKAAVVVCAADHGVSAQGVSAYPASVTPHMVHNFLAGGAAINQIAAVAGAEVYVLDVGVNTAPNATGSHIAKVRLGTADISQGPAMSKAEAQQAIQAGMQVAKRAISEGATVLAAGDMGIGNTTSAAALTAALLGMSAEAVTGRGTGISDAAYTQKLAVVNKALGHCTSSDPLDLLAQLGGLEIAACVGVFVAGAQAGLPVVTDGFPVTAAALVACRLQPSVRDYLFAGHRSVEPGHTKQLAALALRPVLELDLRLGEGTGAALAIPVLRCAAALLSMATFEEAGMV
jgi:nicotinate-nucleotide--dimethylbenzimidazole phosphoribosyltransferase